MASKRRQLPTFERIPFGFDHAGHINNCSVSCGQPMADCQVCKGRCPDVDDDGEYLPPPAVPLPPEREPLVSMEGHPEAVDVPPGMLRMPPVPTTTLEELGVDPALIDAIRLDPLALESEFVRASADTAYWNTRYAEADEGVGAAEISEHRLEAHLDLYHRQKCEDEGRKVTEPLIKSLVANDESLFRAKVATLRAKVWRTKVKGWCSALSVKRDMLMQQGAHVREELRGDPSLRSTMAGAAVMSRVRRLGPDNNE